MGIKEKIKEHRLAHSGRSVPLGVGCAWLGRKEDRVRGTDLLLTCYERGFRFFDTSREYGESELAVGDFIKQVPRESLFISTKSDYRESETGGERDFEKFKRNFYESFVRLQIDKIDLFLIHDTDNYICCEEKVIPFLEDRISEGLISYIGLGTRSLNAHENAVKCGKAHAALSYLNYNLQNKGAKGLIEECAKRGAAFINASVFNYGMLRLENPLESEGMAQPWIRRHLEITHSIKLLCDEMGVSIFDAATQLSLFNPGIDMTLIGIKRLENIEATFNSLDAVIYPEQWARILSLQDEFPLMYVQDNLYG